MLKRIIKKIIQTLGYNLISIESCKPTDLTKLTNIDPINLDYLNGEKKLLINVSLKRGRGLPFHSFNHEDKFFHPFSFAVAECEKSNSDIKEIIKTTLLSYYEQFKLNSLSEFLDIKLKEEFPAWAIVMPWEKKDLNQWKRVIEKSVLFENQIEKKNFGIEKGWSWLGPVSGEKLEIELNRLLNIYTSIKKKGYKRHNEHDGDITVDILVDENLNWVWQAVGGQHRASVLAGLKYKEIPVRVRNIIRKSDIKSWPNFINKNYSEEECLKIFNNVFTCDYKMFGQDWLKTLGRNYDY